MGRCDTGRWDERGQMGHGDVGHGETGHGKQGHGAWGPGLGQGQGWACGWDHGDMDNFRNLSGDVGSCKLDRGLLGRGTWGDMSMGPHRDRDEDGMEMGLGDRGGVGTRDL